MHNSDMRLTWSVGNNTYLCLCINGLKCNFLSGNWVNNVNDGNGL